MCKTGDFFGKFSYNDKKEILKDEERAEDVKTFFILL